MNSGKDIPIVFIHKGYSWYLNYTLYQAMSLNKNSDFYLIGDEHVNTFSKVEFVDFVKYKDSVREFHSHYRHLSSNDRDIELFCFERWFYLRDLMKEHNLQKVFTCDSDVMLFSDISKEEPATDYLAAYCIPHKTEDFKLSASAHISFWTYDGINEFCNFISSIYSAERFPVKIEKLWNLLVEGKIKGGISDMAFLCLFAKERNIINLLEVTDSKVYDDNISFAHNFFCNEYKVADGIKSITWRDKMPHCYNILREEEVRFMALHFQGSGKNRIPEIYKIINGTFNASVMKFKNKVIREVRKIRGMKYK